MMSCSEISRRFSEAAPHYDQAARIQGVLASELGARVRIRPGSVVVDVGSGTGNLLRLLKRKEPDAVYVGIDAAEGMLALADGIRVQADYARLPFRPMSMDLVVSSSCYQWAMDLHQAFAAAAAVLKPGGRFHAVLFGKNTLSELFAALGAGSPELAVSLSQVVRPPSLEDVCGALSLAGFSALDFESEIRQDTFDSVRDILLWLRAIGAHGTGRGTFIGKGSLCRAEDYYRLYCEKKVSFEVIWLEAHK